MSPQDNSDVALSVYADWLEENGYPDQSNELRADVQDEETKTSWIYLPSVDSGWANDCASGSGSVGVGYHNDESAGTGYTHVGACLHGSRVGAGSVYFR